MRRPIHSAAYWAAMSAWLNAPLETPAEALCRAIRESQARKRRAAAARGGEAGPRP